MTDLFPATVTCEWCSKSMPNDPGAWYHEKACEADAVERELDAARERGDDVMHIRRLERRLEQVRYVGD